MKKIIARISNGIGNQMFLYASAFSIAKKLNRELELDIFSGLQSMIEKSKKKEFKNFEIKYELNIFKISSQITSKTNTFNNFYKKIYRKILLIEDRFNLKKNFIFEIKNKDKKNLYTNNFDNLKLKDVVYLEGYFESEKYFQNYRKDIINEFTLNRKIICKKKYLNHIDSSNSISICIRADRFNETKYDDLNTLSINKSINFEKKQFEYIVRSINFLKTKINKPHFYLFSDNINKISNLFKEFKDVTLINEYNENKIHEDFFLMSKCKHHIVAPTTFHFWPAWLSEYKDKICIRPKNMNVSNNIDYWPVKWISL